MLFVNTGLLGARTFGTRLFPVVAREAALPLSQVVLTDGLTLAERAVRRVACQRLWPARLRRAGNLDFARYRQEWHTGMLGRRRLRQRGHDAFDVLVFYRQPAAWGSVGLMRRVPSIVAIDCTQMCMLRAYDGWLERATLAPNIRRDGRVFDAARAIICNSRWAAGTVAQLYPRCATPTHVIPPPVDVSAFRSEWIAQRQNGGARSAKPRVLFAAGDFARKGGAELLRLWQTSGVHERAELHIMTDWKIDQRELPPRVFLHRGLKPYSDAWMNFWRDGDVFAFPTRHEAFGMVLQEAAAAALARIGTRENAGPELIEDGDTGVLVEPGDGAALARAIATLVDNRELRLRMGRAARAWVERTAAPAVYARALERVVYDVARKASR